MDKTKIRKFFGIGRKPRQNRGEKEQLDVLENFIVGSTDQKASEEYRSKSVMGSKSDSRNN